MVCLRNDQVACYECTVFAQIVITFSEKNFPVKSPKRATSKNTLSVSLNDMNTGLLPTQPKSGRLLYGECQVSV